jgi:tRNA (cytidine/uridine-2'-O-)-methyltransferase
VTDDPASETLYLSPGMSVELRYWDSLGELQGAQNLATRYFYCTTKSDRPYHAVWFKPGDFLVFGRETKGLPETLLRSHPNDLLTIPMHGTRSLNLATAVAIVLFEAMRQQRERRARESVVSSLNKP